MSRNGHKSSLLAKYLAQYEREPNSRVFAPLAESYRKLGMIKDALEVLSQGLKKHPNYTLAHIILGNCFFDKGDFDSAYKALKPHISSNRDNIKLLRLFGDCCFNIMKYEEALEAYKFLLLVNPRDEYAKSKVNHINEEILVEKKNQVPKFQSPSKEIDDEDDWTHVSFADMKENQLDPPVEKVDPVVSLTIIDLYIAQGHPDKANELLLKFEELHPENKEIHAKRIIIDKILKDNSSDIQENSLESTRVEVQSKHTLEPKDDYDRLLNLIEAKVKAPKPEGFDFVPEKEELTEDSFQDADLAPINQERDQNFEQDTVQQSRVDNSEILVDKLNSFLHLIKEKAHSQKV